MPTRAILMRSFMWHATPHPWLVHTSHTAAKQELQIINFIALEFTNQKNGVWIELVGLGKSGHASWCPMLALFSRICHLCTFNIPLTTPLYCYFDEVWWYIDMTTLTSQLCLTITAIGRNYGLPLSYVSIQSLRASGAMALLCARVDINTIRLLGHWRSNEMLWYLHLQSYTIVAPLASRMLQQGDFLSSQMPHWPANNGKRLPLSLRWAPLTVTSLSAQPNTLYHA